MMHPQELTADERACLGVSPQHSSPDDSPRAGAVSEQAVQAALVDIWRDFALRWSSLLSQRLKADSHVDVHRIVQPSYGEFVFGLENPTCFLVSRAAKEEWPVLIEINPAILFPIFDRMLGGELTPGDLARRPLTHIEKRLARYLAQDLLSAISVAWQHIHPLGLQLQQTESNPRQIRITHPGDPMVVAEMTLHLGDISGSVRVAMQWSDVVRWQERIIDPRLRIEAARNASREGHRVSVILANSTIGWDELIDLRVGDIVATEADAESAAVLHIDDQPAYLVQVGAAQGRKAAKLLEPIEGLDEK